MPKNCRNTFRLKRLTNKYHFIISNPELQFQVDIYGGCGTHQCPRAKSSECFNVLERDYKFYLAFENSNCIDYITEKFYVNGLM